MLGAKTPLKKAEQVKKELIEKNILDNNFRYVKQKDFIIFPITNKVKVKNVEFVEKEFSKNLVKLQDMKKILAHSLTPEELNILKTAHDTIGTIAILEIDEPLRKKEKIIAQALLDSNKSIKTVLRKDGSHEGDFRTQKFKFLAGVNTKETIHKENNIKLKLNVQEVYYSPRSSTERKRIYELVKKGENVLVMFSGCAPAPCVISKNTFAREIVGIEINPIGHKYAVENVKLNKLKNVILINGDVRKDAPALAKKGILFDRILMPLPKTAEEFLDVALPLAKKGAVIHLYAFYHEDEFHKAHDEIDKYCKAQGRKYKILDTVKCGQFGPQIYRITVDFQLLN